MEVVEVCKTVCACEILESESSNITFSFSVPSVLIFSDSQMNLLAHTVALILVSQNFIIRAVCVFSVNLCYYWTFTEIIVSHGFISGFFFLLYH